MKEYDSSKTLLRILVQTIQTYSDQNFFTNNSKEEVLLARISSCYGSSVKASAEKC